MRATAAEATAVAASTISRVSLSCAALAPRDFILILSDERGARRAVFHVDLEVRQAGLHPDLMGRLKAGHPGSHESMSLGLNPNPKCSQGFVLRALRLTALPLNGTRGSGPLPHVRCGAARPAEAREAQREF